MLPPVSAQVAMTRIHLSRTCAGQPGPTQCLHPPNIRREAVPHPTVPSAIKEPRHEPPLSCLLASSPPWCFTPDSRFRDRREPPGPPTAEDFRVKPAQHPE